MTDIKELISIGAIIFSAGVLWQMVKALKENLIELREQSQEMKQIILDHETRLTVLEIPKKRRK